MTAVWTVKTQSKRISSHLKNGSPTKPIRYKLVCEQNVFCYRDVRSYLEANYPKSHPFALKITLAFVIHGVMFSLLRCLLLPSPSSLLELNFKSASSPGVLAPEVFRCEKSSPARIYSRRSCVCCSVPFAWEIARDSPIVNIALVSQTMNKQVNSSWILWSLMGSLSVGYCPERKNAPWRQTTVWRHGIYK